MTGRADGSRAGEGAALRLAQVANYVGPTSGGLRVVVQALGSEQVNHGAERLSIVPAPADGDERAGRDRRVSVTGPRLPASGGGHHVLLARREVTRLLAGFAPDVLEIHDQTILAWLTGWARRHGVPVVVFAHEQLAQVVTQVTGLPALWTDPAVRAWIRRLAARSDAVVCASSFAARPFDEAGVGHLVHRIPFGVDLVVFRPEAAQGAGGRHRPSPWRDGSVRLVQVSRLHPEKAPHLALDTVAWLRGRGVPAELVLVGSGPLDAGLRRRVDRERLPVHQYPHLADRAAVAALLASADVALSLGPRETFGLSVLEAMACGTPVVVHTEGASRELLAPGAGDVAASGAEAASAVCRLLADPVSGRRARARAETFSWQATAEQLRALYRSLPSVRPTDGVRPARPVASASRSMTLT